MNELKNGSGRERAWNNIYSSSWNDSPWKSLRLGSSMNAIAFGFVATAILISMFLVMALFEHLFAPSPTHPNKLEPPPEHHVQTSHASDFSVVMPGQQYPSFIAQPAPLPLPREGLSLSLPLSLSHPIHIPHSQ